MEEYLTYDLIHHIIGFQSVILLIMISNIWITRRARRHLPPKSFPLVSVLVPARNEARNITDCVHSLLAQDYPSFEILVLDDQSTDSTRTILQEIGDQYTNLIILDGKPKPSGQIGKSWACTQLAQQAKGELLLFTDADTFHKPDSLKSVVTSMIGEKADLLTGFPSQQAHTWGEKLLVPFFSWAMICFNPLWVAYQLRLPELSSAVGQMMLFRREAYFTIGGHAGVNTSLIDDLALARLIKSHGLRWRVTQIADTVSCRMYHNSREAYNGFVKNIFAAFDYHLLPCVFVFTWLFVMFWTPLIVLPLMIFGFAPLPNHLEIWACIGLSTLLWSVPYRYIGFPLYMAILYPVTILANIAVAFQSIRCTIAGKLSWKDRPLAKQNWKWL
jgi:chlorobactene glucosyltransferase